MAGAAVLKELPVTLQRSASIASSAREASAFFVSHTVPATGDIAPFWAYTGFHYTLFAANDLQLCTPVW